MITASIAHPLLASALQASGVVSAPTVNLIQAISAVLALTGMTAAVYRLGILREQMSSTERTVATELARSRDDMVRSFEALERRITVMDSAVGDFIRSAAEHRVVSERWQGRVEIRLDTIDRRLTLLENDQRSQRVGAVA